MSIAAMTKRAAGRPADDVADAPPASDKIRETALEKITAFIPTEVIGIYIAGVGIMPVEAVAEPGEPAPVSVVQWAIFWVALALVPIFVTVNAALLNRALQPGSKLKPLKVMLLVGFGGVAFCAWALALPETPFRDLVTVDGISATQIGAFAVVVLGLLMPSLAKLAGVGAEG